jgi:hypothetical protein
MNNNNIILRRYDMKKTIKQLAMIFIVLLIASVCAAAPAQIPAKYNLDDKLEKITEISKYNFMSWETVDNQSFVLQTSPSDYYLIVLSSPSNKILFSENVKINSTNSMVKPGYNNVIINNNGMKEECIINKIYKFKDAKQKSEITAQLAGEKK